MTKVVSIKFRGRGKTYFFDPGAIACRPGDLLVVETSRGLELGECALGNHTVDDERVVPPLRPVVRAATQDDLRIARINRERERDALVICRKKIEEHGLDMKLVDVECSFEGNKILFFFTSDGRVDFRELVKDLAGVFRTRIELRQIGVRDEAKLLGGLGICGRPFCCNQFLDDFQPVSTKMAKVQSMSLNPTKISGSCGRLMCCLRYEQDAYEELVRGVPKNGAFVETPAGYGNITQVNLLRQTVKVKLDGTGEPVIKSYGADEVAAVPGGRPKAGEPLPNVLKIKPKPVEIEEPEEDPWAIYAVDDGTPISTSAHAEPEAEPALSKSARRRKKKKASPAAALEARPQETKAIPAPDGARNQQKPRRHKNPAPRPAGEKPAEKPADEVAPAKKKNGYRRRYYKPKGE